MWKSASGTQDSRINAVGQAEIMNEAVLFPGSPIYERASCVTGSRTRFLEGFKDRALTKFDINFIYLLK